MQKLRSFFTSENFVLLFIAGLVYLVFVPRFGYFNDDWYLMYAAGAKGAAVFKDIFIVDRPMRALVMAPAYLLFGNNPVLYNISALGFRVLSAVIFFKFLCLLWPNQKKIAWMTALLYLIYPGFLSQFNGIDYQSQMVSLAVGMFSLLLVLYAYRSMGWLSRVALFILLAVTTTFYLGLVEYFIGMEALKLASLFVLVFRDEMDWSNRIKKSIFWSVYSLLASLPFLFWRLFIFKSERGATDVDVKFSDVLADPMASLQGWISTLVNDIGDVSLGAWFDPLRRVSSQVTMAEWLVGGVIALVVLVLVWLVVEAKEKFRGEQAGVGWRMEALWMGVVMLLLGLIPVILVGRYVDFKSFSRYALAPSIGVVILWQVVLSFIPAIRIRNILFAILAVISSLTHYGNAISRVRETERMNQFWWQVSWRIPQMEEGTTLMANYPDVPIEEDYFIWGPANLIYYPESMHEDYPQPGVYALLMTDRNTEKIYATEKQEFSNRRSIRTYPNYRNILILTQPALTSCVQVIDGIHPEYSSYEDERFTNIGSFSEAVHIMPDVPSHTPPTIPFGEEPAHGWCFYYQKASLARQVGDWNEVLRLGEEANSRGLIANDQIEWMPFLQAYAYVDNVARLNEIASFMTSDLPALQQACLTLTAMPINSATSEEITQSFCQK